MCAAFKRPLSGRGIGTLGGPQRAALCLSAPRAATSAAFRSAVLGGDDAGQALRAASTEGQLLPACQSVASRIRNEDATDSGFMIVQYTAAQALDYRRDMLNAARRLARRGDWRVLAAKIGGAPEAGYPQHAQFEQETRALMQALADAPEFRPGAAVARALEAIRREVAFMPRDRAMDGDIARMVALTGQGLD